MISQSRTMDARQSSTLSGRQWQITPGSMFSRPTCRMLSTLSRLKVLEQTEKFFPDIVQWVKSSYGTTPELVFGGNTIESRTGLAQGDPIAPLLFSLVLQELVLKIEEEVPTLEVNAWYLDDGVQVGDREELQKVMDILITEGPSRGLVLNILYNMEDKTKCKTTVWQADFELFRETMPQDFLGKGARAVTEQGFILLGAPIGSDTFSRLAVGKRIDDMKLISERPRADGGRSGRVCTAEELSVGSQTNVLPPHCQPHHLCGPVAGG